MLRIRGVYDNALYYYLLTYLLTFARRGEISPVDDVGV